jgi:cytochrome c-type biogenesis protein CcmE
MNEKNRNRLTYLFLIFAGIGFIAGVASYIIFENKA